MTGPTLEEREVLAHALAAYGSPAEEWTDLSQHAINGYRSLAQAAIGAGWGPTAALVAEVERLQGQVARALNEIGNSTYGDAEIPFRVRAHLEPENIGVTFGVGRLLVPEPGFVTGPDGSTTSDLGTTEGERNG